MVLTRVGVGQQNNDVQSKSPPLPPAVNTGGTPMYIDSPPPSSRTTLPPIETPYDQEVRRGSITDPSMHATSSTDPYRNSNGSVSRTQSYQSYPPPTGSRPQ